MDSISQAALGASIGEAVLGRKVGFKGMAAGAAIATIPDLDVILLPFFSAVQRISIHRGYSHSILFTIIASFLIASILIRTKWLKDVSYLRLILCSWLALFTHILLDGFTSYGTQMFLPFSDFRVSFDSITIVDPIYTLPLLVGLTLCFTLFRAKRRQRSVANWAGLIISTIYLLLTLTNKLSVKDTFVMALQMNGIEYEKLMTVPVSAANVHWFAVARSDESLFIGDYSQIKRKEIHFEEFPINDHLLDQVDPILVDRLKWFSKDYYSVAELNGIIRFYNMQCDMQGIRTYGEYKAPTAFFYEIKPKENGTYTLTSGMHEAEE